VDLAVKLPEDVFAPLVSITGGIFDSPLIGFITTWLMFTIALYKFGPLAYSRLDVLPQRKAGFRGIFAASAVVLGIGWQQTLNLNEDYRLGVLLAVMLPGTTICGGLLVTYLVKYHGWDMRDPRGNAVEVLNSIAPQEDVRADIESDLAYEGWLGRLATISFLLAVILVLTFPVVLAVVIVQALFYAFPVPDLIFLGWAVSTYLFPLIPVAPTRNPVAHLRFDFEKYLVDAVENATRSLQGLFMTTWILLGLLFSGGYLFIAVGVVPQVFGMIGLTLGGLPATISFEVLLILWNWIGVLVMLIFAGTLGLWVWIRELHRLPHFLDIWENRTTRLGVTPMIRVPGFVIIPVVGWLLTVAFVVYSDSRVIAIGYSILWPLFVGLGVRKVLYQPYQRSIRSIGTEHIWIVSGIILQVVTLWTAVELDRLLNALSGSESILSVLTVPIGMTVLVFLTTTIPIINRYESQYDDFRRYTLVGMLLGLGTLAAGGLLVVPVQYKIGAIGLSIAGWVGGLLLGAARYYDL
jgi:hypothetical protein